MKVVNAFIVSTALILRSNVGAFSPGATYAVDRDTALFAGYVPDGMSPDQWKRMKEDEKAREQKKQYGRMGPKGFMSRSLQSFQEDLEKGKTSHLMPVMYAKKLVKDGKLKEEDVPYMQRGGAWDNSDVRGAKKKEWSKTDKKYKSGSMWAPGIDWTGEKKRAGPQAQAAAVERSTVKEETSSKKWFGLFP